MRSGKFDTAERTVLAYLDGDLDTAEAEAARLLIETDPDARDLYDSYRKLYDDLHGAAPSTPAIGSGVYPDIIHSIDGATEVGFSDYDTFYGDAYRRISGELSEDDAAAFDARLSESPVHQDAYSAITQGVADLEQAGDTYRRRAATIDITDDLMAAIQPVTESNPKIVAFRPRSVWKQALAVAASIAVVAALYLAYRTTTVEEVAPPIANHEPEQTVEAVDPELAASPSMDDLQQALSIAMARAGSGQRSLPRVGPMSPDPTDSTTDTQVSESDEEPILEMVALRRVSFDPLADPVEQDNALQKLLRFAAIGETSARRIANDADANPRIRAAVAKFLPSDEALSTLYAAMAASPDDPYIRFNLAVHQLEQQEIEPSPENDAAAIAAALDFASTAPENATAYMMEAAARLAAGDGAGALEALAQAQTAGSASTYAAESANLRAEAMSLIEGNANEATVAAALTAGLDEYGFIEELGGELLIASEATLANGDAESATAIASAVYGYGQQLEDSALYAFEHLAIIDLEHGVLGLFDSFRDLMLPDTEALALWTNEAESVTQDTDAISAVFNQLDAAFLAIMDTDRIVELAHGILGFGDMAVAEAAEAP